VFGGEEASRYRHGMAPADDSELNLMEGHEMRNGTCIRYLLYVGALISAAPYSSGTSGAVAPLAFLYLPL